MVLRAAALIGSVLVLACACPAQRSLKVRVDPALNDAVRSIAVEFEKARKGAKIEVVSSGSANVTLGSAIPTQAAGKRLFALDRLVIVAPVEPSRVTKFAHIGLNLKLAVPSAKTLPGRRAASVLQNAMAAYGRDWWANVKRNSTLTPDNSADAVRLVLTGQADAALVNANSAVGHGTKLRIVPVPLEINEPIEEFAISDGSSLSKAFIEFLYSKGNQQRLAAQGFSSPIAPSPDIAIIKPGSMMRLFTAALGTLKQESVKVEGQTYKGASLASILSGKGSMVKIVGADGYSVSLPLRAVTRRGILSPMGDGNYRIVLPGRPVEQWVRWVRRIEVS